MAFDVASVLAAEIVGAHDPAAARQLIRIGIMVGGADGTFDDKEKDVVRKACRELGLSPADFEL